MTISTKMSFLLAVLVVLLAPLFSCKEERDPNIEKKDTTQVKDDTIIIGEDSTIIQSAVDSSKYNLGIPIYTVSQGSEFWSEFNTRVAYYSADGGAVNFKRVYLNNNPYLECVGGGSSGKYGMRLSLFKSFLNPETLPDKIAERLEGIRFNAFGTQDAPMLVQVLDANGNLIIEQIFQLESNTFKSYELAFTNVNAKEVIFSSSVNSQDNASTFGIDDIYLMTTESGAFYPPQSDTEFLGWLKEASYNFFEWNYLESGADLGVILESYKGDDKVSLSGIGYAYAIYIIAAEEGYITPEVAHKRIKQMLNWQVNQNWFDGSGGWHGFPHHYFKPDGSYLWPDVSTIDWAICAAGIRVAKQYYQGDSEIVAMADVLLSRPDWSAALAENDKIAMGFDGNTGEMNDYRWALAFSEETEIVYLEAVASGDLEPSVFDAIIREEKSGFYPSWFGAGFTYNWLQLWTGAVEPFKTNSIAAYNVDAATCLDKFGIPVMGLTACSTIKEATEEGFLNWGQYISNQGGITRLTNGSVIQVSPAPYGAALALPFTYDKAMTALRSYVDMGYYHEYLGLPDNVRLRDLPDGVKPAPYWDPFDINIGPMIMAIEQVQGNRIGLLYKSDPNIDQALAQLIQSFP